MSSITNITPTELFKHMAFISINKERLKRTLNRLNVLENLNLNGFMVFGKDMGPIYNSTCNLAFKKLSPNMPEIYKNNRNAFNIFFKNYLHNYGCSISHTYAINYAKKNNWPFILIFEDDVVPCINCLEHLTAALNKLPKDWEVIKLEESFEKLIPAYNYIPTDTDNNFISYKHLRNWWIKNFPNDRRSLCKLCIGIGAGAYIVNASIFDRILDNFEKASNHKIFFTPIADVRIFDYKLYYYHKILFCQDVRYELYKEHDAGHWPELNVLKIST